ncbi:MAG: ABC transporter substrate-binding protein [Chloroflexi bacterium]|nr:ABC transporter substrate-binding protein [Chloroflexota bacterium]
MATLRLTLACGEYDRTLALLDGRVQADGLELQLVPMNNAFERHDRMIRQEAFDVCELSMSSYLMARQRGQAFHAIPVFPYRMFRHGYVLVNRGAGIEQPADLVGKRMGIAMYQVTTALWVRGHLLHEYGVGPQQMAWYTEMPELVGFAPPPGVAIHQVAPGSLEPMLLRGDLDALILIEEVPQELLRTPQVRRLFPNYAEVEREFYLRTRIYPVMHALVVKEPILRQHPWLADSLRRAFEQAKQIALEQLRYPRTVTLAWAGAYREQELEVFGYDPYPYGLEANRPTLEALATYSHEQSLTRRRFAVEELFVPDAGGE